MSQVLRFGVIGCGRICDVHAANLARMDSVEVAAWCDLSEERAERKRGAYGGAYATQDAQKVLADKGIDGVLILTALPNNPAGLHAELALRAAQAGKHVFLEKPIAETVPQAYDVMAALLEANVKFQLGFCFQYSPTVARAKQLMPNPAYSVFQCAGGLAAQACHNLDLIVHVFHEARLVSVFAAGGRYFASDPELSADSFAAALKFEDGTTSSYVQHNIENPALAKFSAQLLGPEGCVYLRDRFRDVLWFPASGEPAEPFRDEEGYMGHRQELEDFVRCILENRQPKNTAARGKHVLAIEKAILESIDTGRVIEIGG